MCICLSVCVFVSCVHVFLSYVWRCLYVYSCMCSSFYSRDGGVTKYIDQLLATVNIFSTVSAFSCRARLCVLGETMMTTLIQLLGNRTQPSKVKVEYDQLYYHIYMYQSRAHIHAWAQTYTW